VHVAFNAIFATRLSNSIEWRGCLIRSIGESPCCSSSITGAFYAAAVLNGSAKVRRNKQEEPALTVWTQLGSRLISDLSMDGMQAVLNAPDLKCRDGIRDRVMPNDRIYLRADRSRKLDAVSAFVPPTLKRGRFHASGKLLASSRGS
jgi:hypothetical protein